MNNNNNQNDNKENTCWFIPNKLLIDNKVKLKVLLFCEDPDDYYKEKEKTKGKGSNVIEFDIIKSLDKNEKDGRFLLTVPWIYTKFFIKKENNIESLNEKEIILKFKEISHDVEGKEENEEMKKEKEEKEEKLIYIIGPRMSSNMIKKNYSISARDFHHYLSSFFPVNKLDHRTSIANVKSGLIQNVYCWVGDFATIEDSYVRNLCCRYWKHAFRDPRFYVLYGIVKDLWELKDNFSDSQCINSIRYLKENWLGFKTDVSFVRLWWNYYYEHVVRGQNCGKFREEEIVKFPDWVTLEICEYIDKRCFNMWNWERKFYFLEEKSIINQLLLEKGAIVRVIVPFISLNVSNVMRAIFLYTEGLSGGGGSGSGSMPIKNDNSIPIYLFKEVYIILKQLLHWIVYDVNENQGVSIVVGNLKDVVDVMNKNNVSLMCGSRVALCPNKEMVLECMQFYNTPAIYIDQNTKTEEVDMSFRSDVDATRRTVIVLESHLFTLSTFGQIFQLLKNIPKKNIYLSGSSSYTCFTKLCVFSLLSEYSSLFSSRRYFGCHPYIDRLLPPPPLQTSSSFSHSSFLNVKDLSIYISVYSPKFNNNESQKCFEFISQIKKDLNIWEYTVTLTDNFNLMIKNNSSVDNVVFEVGQMVLTTKGVQDTIKSLNVKSISGLYNRQEKMDIEDVRTSVVNLYYKLSFSGSNTDTNMEINKIYPTNKYLFFIGKQRLTPLSDVLFITKDFTVLDNSNVINTLAHLAISRLYIVKINMI